MCEIHKETFGVSVRSVNKDEAGETVSGDVGASPGRLCLFVVQLLFFLW